VLARPDYVEVYRVKQAVPAARAGFGLTAKTTRLTLTGEHLAEQFDEHVRETSVYGEDELLPLALVPITDLVAGQSIELEQRVDGLEPGRRLVIVGRIGSLDASGQVVAGPPATEVATLLRTVDLGGRSRLDLVDPLAHAYVRDSLIIRANVAAASHGETVASEVLGSGDPAVANQSFALKQVPVTYVAASTPSGGASTLEVRVDDVRWQEVPSLYGRGASERVYVTRADAEGKRTLRFGDGYNGARPPLGSENVVARYRKGLGTSGNVRAGQLSLLLARPLGVARVDNPLASSGAQDPESLGSARDNAPLTVITLDRIVSLEDYADFARSFAGIGKAHAAWTWHPSGRGVSITVAGMDGADVPDGSALREHLLDAIRALASMPAPVLLRSYRPVTMGLAATVTAEPDRRVEHVRADVLGAVRSAFSFRNRAFGQSVYLSEVFAVIQRVPGVRMVVVDQLYRTAADGTVKMAVGGMLEANAPRDGDDAQATLAAELLTVAGANPLDQVKVIQ
jgi:predicted phage baseplate assembly protein